MITKKTEYAIRALWELAQSTNGPATSSQIAQRQSIPAKFLPQIMSELSRSGLVRSARGYGGGLTLGRSAADITLLEVIETIQGKLYLFDCMAFSSDCPQLLGCELRDTYQEAQDGIESVFGSMKLSDLNFRKRSKRKRR